MIDDIVQADLYPIDVALSGDRWLAEVTVYTRDGEEHGISLDGCIARGREHWRAGHRLARQWLRGHRLFDACGAPLIRCPRSLRIRGPLKGRANG